jgi:hypothetical protein
MAMNHPRVLHGGLTIEAFTELLEQWSDDQPASVGSWSLLPPKGIDYLRRSGPWLSNNPHVRIRLLGNMPESDAPYLVEHLQGTGSQMDIGEDYNPLAGKMTKLRPTRDAWFHDYMHASIGDQTFANLVIDIPVPLAVTTSIDHDSFAATVELHYRPPMEESSFEVRLGEEPWAPDLPPLDCRQRNYGPDGWWVSSYATRVKRAGDYTLWITRTQTTEDFDWGIPIQIGDPDPLTSRVRDLLEVWFSLNRLNAAPTFAKALEPRPTNPPRGTASGRYFEAALHAACTGLGLPTLYGDQTLMTPGVDILAFDRPRQLVFAISAVTDTNIDAKLTKWIAVQDRVVTTLAPDWTVRPIIITNRPLADCNPAHIVAAYHKGVMVLGAEDLDYLKESPPNLEDFGKTLRLTLLGRQAGHKLVPLSKSDSGWRIIDLN